MTSRIEALDWDTDFFGFPIGRVALDGTDGSTLAEIDAEARDRGLLCLYGSLDPIDAQTAFRVQGYGYRFVDAATSFDLRVDEPPIPRPPGIEVRLGTMDDLPSMEDLIARLGEWSRFAVDPRFGLEAGRRMQTAWIERAAGCDTGEFQLLVAEDETGIIAFISRAAKPHPVVDTVGTSRHGSGAARFLSQDTRVWAGDRSLYGGPIAARNVYGMRYAENCGYRVRQVRYLYHRWLDEDTDGRR